MTDHRHQIEEDIEELRHLQREIDAARQNLPEAKAAERAHFIDRGEEGTDQIDDTIVPPA